VRGLGRICSLVGSAILVFNLMALWRPHDVEWWTVVYGVVLILVFAFTETATRAP
jgi:hypothetical protein